MLGFDPAGAEGKPPNLHCASDAWELIAKAVSHWNRLPGFYMPEYWKGPGFIQQIVDAVDECRNTHKRCGTKDLGVLPGMILDVSSSGTNGRVFLREPGQQKRGDYIALSYCWGGPQKVVTEMANRAEHQQHGIELSRLPRTISDAARVTVSLRIRYLWVDALCIVQDDHTSKALEIEKMGDIYANATLVLVAGGVVRRANEGFLEPQGEFAVVPIRVGKSCPGVPVCLAPGDLEVSHIDSRGWTFQERHLASRTLEFRGSRGVSLSCQESFITYVGGAHPDGTDAWEPDERKLSEKLAVRANARGLWQAMLEEYTVRRLTKTDDRLPALAGFARMWALESPSSPGKYMAGLWEGLLVDDLMWRSGVQHMDSDVRISLDRYRKPGWSWISVLDHDEPEMLKAGSFITNPQRIRTRLGGYDENKASLVRHSVSLAHADAPFGRVLGGEITLRAQVVPIPKSLGGEKERGRWEAILRSCDYRLSAADIGRLLLLRLKIGGQWDPLTSRAQHGDGGLLILPRDQNSSVCMRVGCFWDWSDAEDGVPLVDWYAVGFQETTLI